MKFFSKAEYFITKIDFNKFAPHLVTLSLKVCFDSYRNTFKLYLIKFGDIFHFFQAFPRPSSDKRTAFIQIVKIIRKSLALKAKNAHFC